MSFWNPLIGGKRVLEIDFNEPVTGQTSINLATYVSTNNPTGLPNNSYDEIRLTVPSDYIIGSPSPGTSSLTVGSWQPHQNVVLINNGYIVGKGGSASGGAGGTAINVDTTTMSSFKIENNSGGIIGGGGGGGDNGTPTPGTTPVPTPTPAESCVLDPAAGGAGGGGAGYLVGSPNATLTPAPVASTPSASFPIAPVSFNIGAGVAGETKVGCQINETVEGDPFVAPAPPYTGGTGVPGNPLGTNSPGRGAAGAYLTGPGVPKTTIINNGNLYGPSPYGNEPGQ